MENSGRTMDVAARIEELKRHPEFGGWTAEAIADRAACDIGGHAAIVDRQCVRCRDTVREVGMSTVGSPDQIEPQSASRCPHYTHDQGCPLHGELCG